MQRIIPTTLAVHLQNVRDLTGPKRKKKKKRVIYYSDTGNIEAYFHQNILIIFPRNKLVNVYSTCSIHGT